MYVNVGAHDREGRRYRTKRALREALDSAPSEVIFYSTEHNTSALPEYRADSIPTGVRLEVVGPDPYKRRLWYANVVQHGGKPRLT